MNPTVDVVVEAFVVFELRRTEVNPPGEYMATFGVCKKDGTRKFTVLPSSIDGG